jgi:hypothetical protein
MSNDSMIVRVGHEPVALEAAEMQSASMARELDLGRAQFLSATIRDFVRLGGRWWIMDRDVWFAVDDEELIGSLNSAALLMADADEGVGAKSRTVSTP